MFHMAEAVLSIHLSWSLLTGVVNHILCNVILNLVHSTDKPDLCEAWLTQDLELDLPDGMLTKDYYERAFLAVFGDGDTSVSFQLP